MESPIPPSLSHSGYEIAVQCMETLNSNDAITRGVVHEVRRIRVVWGHAPPPPPPRKVLHFMSSEIASDAILGNIARL